MKDNYKVFCVILMFLGGLEANKFASISFNIERNLETIPTGWYNKRESSWIFASNIKQIEANWLICGFSDDFRGNESKLLRLNSLNSKRWNLKTIPNVTQQFGKQVTTIKATDLITMFTKLLFLLYNWETTLTESKKPCINHSIPLISQNPITKCPPPLQSPIANLSSSYITCLPSFFPNQNISRFPPIA